MNSANYSLAEQVMIEVAKAIQSLQPVWYRFDDNGIVYQDPPSDDFTLYMGTDRDNVVLLTELVVWLNACGVDTAIPDSRHDIPDD